MVDSAHTARRGLPSGLKLDLWVTPLNVLTRIDPRLSALFSCGVSVNIFFCPRSCPCGRFLDVLGHTDLRKGWVSGATWVRN